MGRPAKDTKNKIDGWKAKIDSNVEKLRKLPELGLELEAMNKKKIELEN